MSYTSLLYHCVFSTKERQRTIADDIQPRLWAYMGGIARTNKMKALAIGGVADHAHLLLSLKPDMPIAKAVQLIKSGSSKWMHEEVGRKLFWWQESYSAFTIGVSQIPVTVRYIENQPEHHRRRSFAEELEMILKKHGMSEK